MNKIQNHKFFSLKSNSHYSNYSYRMPTSIKDLITLKVKGKKGRVLDSLCLYALDQIKCDVVKIKQKNYDTITYNYLNNDYILDCKEKEKSLHQISDVLKFSLKGFLINHSMSVKVSILCDIAIKKLNDDNEIIVCY